MSPSDVPPEPWRLRHESVSRTFPTPVALLIALAGVAFILKAIFYCFRASSSDPTQYARCVVCHVVYRLFSPRDASAFVCATCARDRQETPHLGKSVVPITLVSPVGLKRVNSGFFEVSKYTAPSIIGKLVSMFYHKREKERVTQPEVELSTPNSQSSFDCKICCDISMEEQVLLPCGHSGFCPKCSDSLLLSANACPICRKKIDSVVSPIGSVERGRALRIG